MKTLTPILLACSICIFDIALFAGETTPPFTDSVAVYDASSPQPQETLAFPGGKAMTLAARVRWTDDQPGEITAWQAKGGKAAVRLAVTRAGEKSWVMAEVFTDAKDAPLRLSMPLAALALNEPHDLVVRYSGARVELFADGVLVDEDWPLGSLMAAGGGLRIGSGTGGNTTKPFSGKIERVAVWKRALNDEQMLQISGGRDDLAAREDRILGPQLPVGQFWAPRGFNTHVGDCMPFFHDGRFHLYYLFDRRNHQSKWGLGAHQWAHVSTTNLLNWEYHPMAVGITEEKEGSICTGSTFFHDGTYYGFYAVRMSDGSPAELCAATSPDGIHFTKNPPLARLAAPYEPSSGRDPVVFRDKATGLFHMLVTTSLNEPPVASRGGCLADLVSRDLKHWEQRGPFYVPGLTGQPECADYFEWHGWYYLVFSNDGVARYRMSRHALGPWRRPAPDAFDVAGVNVMKTAAFAGDRRIGAAFLCRGGYGGDVIFREIIQNKDGTLGTRWPGEMLPATGKPVALKLAALTPGVSGNSAGAMLKSGGSQGLVAASLGSAPRDFLLRARVKPAVRSAVFGLRIGAANKMQDGLELRIEPRRGKVGLCDPNINSIEENEYSSIYNVTALDKPFDLELIVKGDIIDVCINHGRTLAVRRSLSGQELFLFSRDGNVTFSDLEVRPLKAR